jgi:two-component system KDP operon response regulator KdpE
MDRARIMLVEDNELNRALVRAVFSRSHEPAIQEATLVEAHTLAEARKVLAAGEVAVILLDIQLPDGSGLELMNDLARLEGQRPAVIAVTGGVLPEQRAAATAAGCDAVVEKPFVTADLVSTVVSQLVRSRPFDQITGTPVGWGG